MRNKNVKVNSLASNPVLVAMQAAYAPYVELKRRERQMMLALMRQQKADRTARLAVAHS